MKNLSWSISVLADSHVVIAVNPCIHVPTLKVKLSKTVTAAKEGINDGFEINPKAHMSVVLMLDR